jgi:hypothetical protein
LDGKQLLASPSGILSTQSPLRLNALGLRFANPVQVVCFHRLRYLASRNVSAELDKSKLWLTIPRVLANVSYSEP